MTPKINVTDNFLPDYEFKQIEGTFMTSRVNVWELHSIMTTTDTPYNVRMTVDILKYGDLWDLILPVTSKLKPLSLLKAVGALTFRSPENLTQDLHTDIPEDLLIPGYTFTSVLYLNDCDGYTLFEDGTKVMSKANRLVEFPTEMLHDGASATDADVRGVINLNYVRQAQAWQGV